MPYPVAAVRNKNFGNPVIPWYRAGGAPVPIAAYQPKGAASLAASYINLANPGTYNATVPTAAPTWDVVNGWIFNGSSQYLSTGYNVPVPTPTVIVKFSNVTNAGYIFGCNTGSYFLLCPNAATGKVQYYRGCDAGVIRETAPVLTSGVLAMTNYGYRNGSVDTTALPTDGVAIAEPIRIGSRGAANYTACYIQAFAIYSTWLTAPQVLAVTNAMNLIP